MKKRLLGALLALSLLTSCAAPAGESPAPSLPESPAPVETSDTVTADAVARAIVETQPDPEGFVPQKGEDLDLYLTGLYGLEDPAGMDAAVYAASGVDGREVAVLRLTGLEDGGAPVLAALEEYRLGRLADFFGYSPQQAALVEGGEVVSGGDWAALLICEDMDAARAAFEEAAGRAAAFAPVETAPVEPTPVEPAPVKTVPAEPTPVEPPPAEPTPEETAAPVEPSSVELSPAEAEGFPPFDPPNEYDMTPYDTSAILTAWRTGDMGGLGERDRLILDGARAALEECGISDAMSGYEKELLLHDWLVANCAYDQTVHDPRTPMGREGNLDPYGALVNGYAICLGYATAFQLLMDLAGVECITVVGASSGSREDHAWNMVRLEGEWYCVDVTWDDPTISDPSGYSREGLDSLHHRYFNVTSQRLRDTDHQWDYQSVPEADSTRLAWGGAD